MRVFVTAFLLSIIFSLVCGFLIIPLLRRLNAGQPLSEYVKEHKNKAGTATMGGIFIVISALAVYFLFNANSTRVSLVCVSIGISYLVVGFLDDFIKIKLKHNEGLRPYQKILFELSIAVISAVFAYKSNLIKLNIPYTNMQIDIGVFIIPLIIFIFLATTNSVNLTDGLDGLAGGVSYIYFLFIGAIILLQKYAIGLGRMNDNLALLSFCLSGSVIGFLFFNTYRANVFMGDTGSLSLGGFIACISIFSLNSLFIPLLGITFALSSISDIIQVIHYKRTKRRVFLMAPLHHHFQMKGFAESKIAFAYKLVTLLFGLSLILAYF